MSTTSSPPAAARSPPGYVDIHAHGGWGTSFDDGAEGIATARACHMVHGTTRQVLSLITNPLDVMERNLRTVRAQMDLRPDILGAHLEGPFLALARKGAHDPDCLVDPVPEAVERLLAAADGALRQITIAPELPHGMEAIRTFAAAGVAPAIGHCDAGYEQACEAIDAGVTIMTHMFNAMNGIHHREPGPIPAVTADPRVTPELINDGFHVQDPVVRMAWGFAPHRLAFVTDAMAATDCPDGHYLLGALDVNVEDGHARLVSNGAIAGSTLLLEGAVARAVLELGLAPDEAVEAATLTPARALGLDRPNAVTGAPLGLVAPGYAADLLLTDPATWKVEQVWCAGRAMA
ncbi:N-acetylglucosamine-6-phosphate deacetylase [Bifidobacterium cuniculi]|uniref:N-acetylglucosamine-6-phosphate deacetylase n=1 Tax=Bifidobacterium cuniculi TaxID=1688 RepID=A0A087B3D2_9BIFI|nr:N-acetylglucosamine-6-phosphate deacetylase [Bifidobacterium cuniculi]